MRGLTAFFLICAISASAQTDDATQLALDAVNASGQSLSEAEGQEAYAQEKKREKTGFLVNAQNYLSRLPGWRVISRARQKKKVQSKQRELQRAKQASAAAKANSEKEGQNYLTAEENYKDATGSYSDPQRVEYWQSRITHAPAETEPESEPEEEVTADSVGEETSELMDMMSGGLNPTTMGQLSGKAGTIESMTDKLVAQAISGQGGFSQRTPNTAGAGSGIQGGKVKFSDKKNTDRYSSSAKGFQGRAPLGSISVQTLNEGKILLSDGRGDRLSRRKSTDPYAEKSRKLLASGDAEGALKAANKAIRRNPNSPTGYVRRAQALNKLRRFDEAEDAAKRALDRDQENEKAYKSLIWAQLHNGKEDEASANASRLIRIQPDNAEAYLMRAFAKELLGDREGMMQDLERAARLDSRYNGHLAKARAGERIFDPSAKDSESLLNAIAYEEPVKRRRNFPLIAIGLALLLASAGAPLLKYIQSRQRSTVGAGGRTSTLEFERRTENDNAPAVAAAAAGNLLGGKYHLDQMVGRGGMGKVWKATDTTLDRPVAIKQMVELESGDQQKELLELYRKEARTLANLHHPAIVDIYEVLDLNDGIYLVFEWVEGKTVHQMLAEEHKLPLHRVVAILEPVLEALTFAHSEGVVHRDLKPANIMVNEAGHVKLMDFGIARAVGKEQAVETISGEPAPLNETRTNTVAGTPAYRGPEAARGIVTPAFDIYSMGATFYEMLTGRLPFGPSGAESVHATPFVKASTLAPGLPVNADAIVAFCLQTDYTKRFKDAPALLAELKKL